VASVAAQLFVFFKANQDSEGNQTAPLRAVVTLSYAAIILSISATISSLILTDEFSEMRTRAARSTWVHGDAGEFYGKQWKLLIEYGLRKGTAWVVWHCEYLHFSSTAVSTMVITSHLGLISLLTSCICVIASVVVYIASEQDVVARCIVISLGVIGVLPLLYFVS